MERVEKRISVYSPYVFVPILFRLPDNILENAHIPGSC
jgi:hypothetical protein